MTKNVIVAITIGLFTFSCTTQEPDTPTENNCGSEMDNSEIDNISTWVEQNPTPYDLKNGTEIYSEINDSIRFNTPDTRTFELFLVKLTEDEVVIDAYVPKDETLIEEITCVFMKTKFSELVPKKRKVRFYSYSNRDGSGFSPLEAAIKN